MTKRNTVTSHIVSLIAANLQILWNRDKCHVWNINGWTQKIEQFWFVSNFYYYVIQFNNDYTTRTP
jgi:hypothetical protein